MEWAAEGRRVFEVMGVSLRLFAEKQRTVLFWYKSHQACRLGDSIGSWGCNVSGDDRHIRLAGQLPPVNMIVVLKQLSEFTSSIMPRFTNVTNVETRLLVSFGRRRFT